MQSTHILTVTDLITRLTAMNDQDKIEAEIKRTFAGSPEPNRPDGGDYYETLNWGLYRYIQKMYRDGEDGMCVWRFYKKISGDQLSCCPEPGSTLHALDALFRVYYYSDPLDDLTCLFIPINESGMINDYLNWIKNYFYDANYPTSIMWLYALDSSLSGIIPDEIIFLGKVARRDDDIIVPDLSYPDSILMKRFSSSPDDFSILEGAAANHDFHPTFDYISAEYDDRCLSHTGKQEDYESPEDYHKEWEKFREVLEFGVSDREESGCISFSDLRNSTTFLTRHGKNLFRNSIQQPFFEQTKVVSKIHNGRIDKFMGDNVMCAFLARKRAVDQVSANGESVMNNFFALFSLCKILLELLDEKGLGNADLGLRSGVCFGTQILRSNLGNEIVRDFTVTGGTVNLAARLEHFGIQELIIHNTNYFKDAIERFPQISQLVSVVKSLKNFNPATMAIIQKYTLYQNIISNLARLEKIRFDIRCNQDFYAILKQHLVSKGYEQLNAETAEIHGFEEFNVEGFSMKFFYSFYNPKGFDQFERVWIIPLSTTMLKELEIRKLQ